MTERPQIGLAFCFSSGAASICRVVGIGREQIDPASSSGGRIISAVLWSGAEAFGDVTADWRRVSDTLRI